MLSHGWLVYYLYPSITHSADLILFTGFRKKNNVTLVNDLFLFRVDFEYFRAVPTVPTGQNETFPLELKRIFSRNKIKLSSCVLNFFLLLFTRLFKPFSLELNLAFLNVNYMRVCCVANGKKIQTINKLPGLTWKCDRSIELFLRQTNNYKKEELPFSV